MYNKYNHDLVLSFRGANDNRDKYKEARQERADRDLLDAVIHGIDKKFHAAMMMNAYSSEGLDRALFFATGYDRHNYISPMFRRGANLESVVYGMLLRHVLNDDIEGVQKCLNEGIDGGQYREECFKQALIGNSIDIAERLFDAKIDLFQVMADKNVMKNIWYAGQVVSKTRNYLLQIMDEFGARLDEEFIQESVQARILNSL